MAVWFIVSSPMCKTATTEIGHLPSSSWNPVSSVTKAPIIKYLLLSIFKLVFVNFLEIFLISSRNNYALVSEWPETEILLNKLRQMDEIHSPCLSFYSNYHSFSVRFIVLYSSTIMQWNTMLFFASCSSFFLIIQFNIIQCMSLKLHVWLQSRCSCSSGISLQSFRTSLGFHSISLSLSFPAFCSTSFLLFLMVSNSFCGFIRGWFP